MHGINIPPQIDGTVSIDGGMNDWDAPWLLPENTVVRLENVELDKKGIFSRRRGALTFGAATGTTNPLTPRGLMAFSDAILGQDVLIAAYDNKLYRTSGNQQFELVASSASLTATKHAGQRGYWRGVDTLYVHTEGKSYSNISEASLLTAIDVNRDASQCASMAPRCAAWWQFRLWCGINVLSGDDQTLWWSDINDGLSYSAYNTLRIEPGRGGAITGLVPVRSDVPQILIFKERLIAVLTTYWGSSALIPAASDALDTINSSIRVITDTFGSVSAGTIQYVPGSKAGEVLFLAHDGFRAITRASDDSLSGASLPISAPIRTTMDRINYAHIHKASSVVWNAKYHCAVPMDGAIENTHIITYDLLTGAWYLNTWDAVAIINSRLTEVSDKLWFQSNQITTDSVASGAATGFHLFQAYYGNVDPDGRPVPFIVDTKAFTLGSIRQRKKFSWFGVLGFNEGATSVMEILASFNNGPYTTVTNLVMEPGDVLSVILGTTPLPWVGTSAPMVFRKFGLEDLSPCYTIQFRMAGTGPTDYSRPAFAFMEVAGRVLDPEFSNEIT